MVDKDGDKDREANKDKSSKQKASSNKVVAAKSTSAKKVKSQSAKSSSKVEVNAVAAGNKKKTSKTNPKAGDNSNKCPDKKASSKIKSAKSTQMKTVTGQSSRKSKSANADGGGGAGKVDNIEKNVDAAKKSGSKDSKKKPSSVQSIQLRKSSKSVKDSKPHSKDKSHHGHHSAHKQATVSSVANSVLNKPKSYINHKANDDKQKAGHHHRKSSGQHRHHKGHGHRGKKHRRHSHNEDFFEICVTKNGDNPKQKLLQVPFPQMVPTGQFARGVHSKSKQSVQPQKSVASNKSKCEQRPKSKEPTKLKSKDKPNKSKSNNLGGKSKRVAASKVAMSKSKLDTKSRKSLPKQKSQVDNSATAATLKNDLDKSAVMGKSVNKDPTEPKKAESSSTDPSNAEQPSEPTRANVNDEREQQVDDEELQTPGFDGVMKEIREKRKLTFGPNSKKIVKPYTILMDIYGVISSRSFGSVLKVYAKENMESYVKEKWDSEIVQCIVVRLRAQAVTDRSAGLEVPLIAQSTENEQTQMESAAKNILWQMENKVETTKALIDRLCTGLWSQLYDSGKLKTHAYEEMVDVFQYWKREQFIRIFSYASGSVDGQRLFLKASAVGDLNPYIINRFEAVGDKYQPDTYTNVAKALHELNLQMFIYITDCPKKARNAIKAGMRAIVVNRNEGSDGDKYSAQETEGLVVVNSLAEIQWVGGRMGGQMVNWAKGH